MNLFIVVLSMCASICLYASHNEHDSNIVTYCAPRMGPLTQPLPPYPWDASTTKRFVEYYTPYLCGCPSLACCGPSSPALPVSNDIPCSFRTCHLKVCLAMHSRGCSLTSCCQCTCCVGFGSGIAESSILICSKAPLSVTYPAALLLCGSALLITVPAILLCSKDSLEPCAHKWDRDCIRETIACYNTFAQDRLQRLVQPIVPDGIQVDDDLDDNQ